jgi:hypothetical protein
MPVGKPRFGATIGAWGQAIPQPTNDKDDWAKSGLFHLKNLDHQGRRGS